MYSYRQHFVVIPGAETALPDILKKGTEGQPEHWGTHTWAEDPLLPVGDSEGDDCRVFMGGSLYTACLWSMSVLPLRYFSGYLASPSLLNQMSF